MRWPFSERRMPSTKNPRLRMQELLGRRLVRVGSSIQTSPYTQEMWEDAYDRLVKRGGSVQTAVMFGLGGGSGIRPLYQRFPDCTLTVVEHDPAMVTVARELQWQAPFPFPAVITDDAAQALASLPGPYDLLIVDLFDGKALSPLVTDPAFIGLLRARMAQGGAVFVNFSGHQDAAARVTEHFARAELYTFERNTLGIFDR